LGRAGWGRIACGHDSRTPGATATRRYAEMPAKRHGAWHRILADLDESHSPDESFAEWDSALGLG
jgi:hypothetical protein